MRKYGCWDRVGSLKTRVGKLVVDLGYLVTGKGNQVILFTYDSCNTADLARK